MSGEPIALHDLPCEYELRDVAVEVMLVDLQVAIDLRDISDVS